MGLPDRAPVRILLCKRPPCRGKKKPMTPIICPTPTLSFALPTFYGPVVDHRLPLLAAKCLVLEIAFFCPVPTKVLLSIQRRSVQWAARPCKGARGLFHSVPHQILFVIRFLIRGCSPDGKLSAAKATYTLWLQKFGYDAALKRRLVVARHPFPGSWGSGASPGQFMITGRPALPGALENRASHAHFPSRCDRLVTQGPSTNPDLQVISSPPAG